MQDHPVLAKVALGYSPMINRQRSVLATRLTIFPDHPDAVPDVGELLRALDEVWPASGADASVEGSGESGAGESSGSSGELRLTLRPLDPPSASASRSTGTELPTGHLSLNIAGEALLQAVMAAGPGVQRMLEVPAFMAADPAHASALRTLHASGHVLLIKGRPLKPLTPEMLACFAHSIIEFDDDRRSATAPPPGVRNVSSLYTGARTLPDAASAFERGAVALMGWQFDDPPPPSTGRATVAPDLQVVLELIKGVEAEDPAPKLEAILKRDPVLGFRLMRYLNSPAFGLKVEIQSFGHALMLLGYQRLKRWLVLLLASSSKHSHAKPVIHAAVRRGFIMEELGRSHGDSEMAGEMFICGVFSLLDKLLQQPFSELLISVPVPERVQLALRGEGGPYEPYLDLVRALEAEAVFDIRECTERVFLSQAEVNRALLLALRAGRQLD